LKNSVTIKYGTTENCALRLSDATGLLQVGAEYIFSVISSGYKNATGSFVLLHRDEVVTVAMTPEGAEYTATFTLLDSVFN